MTALVINVYKDQHLAKRLISQIKTHVLCPIIIIADGVPLDACLKDGTIYFEEERLKSIGQGMKWSKRFLELFIKHTTCSHLIKVDPDTCLWRPFVLPDGCDLFGHLISRSKKSSFIHGGCIGFTRQAVEKILNSKLLDKDHSKINYFNNKCGEEVAFQDCIMGDICQELQLKLINWKESVMSCHWPKYKHVAFSHPHRNI